MRVRFVAQPFDNGYDLREFLHAVLGNDEFDELLVVVAWAKRSGLRLFRDELKGFRDRGGSSQLLVGISEGGATRQGLELALQLFDEVLIVHDVSGRTFHPKVYVARGPDKAAVLVGSHNLTRGGAFANYEAGVTVELERGSEDADDFLVSIDEYVENILAESEICVTLTDELLNELASDPWYRIGDEGAGRTRPDDTDTDGIEREERTEAIFKRPSGTRKAAPSRAKGPATGAGSSTPPASPGPPTPPASPGLPTPPASPGLPTSAGATVVVKRWFKEMSRADAQRPAGGTNPTGHLSLVQAGHGIDQTTYFRHDFFGGVPWTGSPKEEAHVEFHTIVRGVDLGVVRLRLSHTPGFEAGQGNRTTVLHWGQNALRKSIKAADLTGDYVTLELLSDKTFRLTIAPSATGSFMA